MERMLKASGEKHQVTYKGNSSTITGDLSADTLKARRAQNDVFQA
jgi:hypothetical protein